MPNMPALSETTVAAISGLISSIVGLLLGYHFGRPKARAETSHENASAANEITDAASKAVQLLNERLDREIEERKAENERNIHRIERLERENTELRSRIIEQDDIIHKQAVTISSQAERIRHLENRGGL